MIAHRINIVGAAGAGTSTLGRALAKAINHAYFEADHFLWIPTDPPHQQTRAYEAKNAMAFKALNTTPAFVISGSIGNWETKVTDLLTHVVYLDTPTEVRLARLHTRELQRHGSIDHEFIAWAAQYEEGTLPGRSRKKHEAWLASLTRPVKRLSGVDLVENNISQLLTWLNNTHQQTTEQNANQL